MQNQNKDLLVVNSCTIIPTLAIIARRPLFSSLFDKFDAFNATLVELLPVIVFELRSKSPVPVTTTLVRSTPVISAELSRFKSFKNIQ